MVKRDPDNTALVRLADDVASVASHVNDSIRERENRNYLWEIQEVFRPPLQLVAAHRMFVREGDLLIRRNHVRRRKARYFFLCSGGCVHYVPIKLFGHILALKFESTEIIGHTSTIDL